MRSGKAFLSLCVVAVATSLLITPPTRAAQPGAAAGAIPATQANPDALLGTIDLREVRINEVIRLVAEVSGVNVVATQAVGERELSLYLRNATARGVVDTVARVAGLWYRWRPETNTFLLMSAEEYQRDISVFREEETRVFRLRHHNVVAAANALRALFGTRVRLTAPIEEPLGEAMRTGKPRQDSGGGSRAGAGGGSGGGDAGRGAGGSAGAGGRTASAGARPEEQAAAATLLAEAGDQLSREELQAARQGTEAPIHVTYNRLHNLLIVRTGDDRALKQAAELMDALDLPTRQVLLEMRIVEVALDNEFRRAFDVDLFAGGNTSGGPGAQPVNPLQTAAAAGPNAVAALGNFAIDSSSTGLFQIINSRIRARLQLLEDKGRVNTLARPMLLASNNEPARLFIGEEVVLITGATSQTTTGVNSPSVTTVTAQTEQRDIGTTLVVHPRINADRTVTLTIDQETSRRVRGGTTIPLAIGASEILDFPIDTVNTAQIQVAALARDTLTIAVGGMIRAETSKSRQQVPGFGDIPVLGNLFARDVETDTRSELVLLITPHILDNAEDAAAVSREQMSPAVEAQNERLDPRPRGPAPDAGVPAPAATRAPAPLPATRDGAADPTGRYVRLTRHALLAQRDPAGAARRDPTIAVRGVPATAVPLWPDPGVAALALGGWQEGGLHATVVRLENRLLRPLDVELTRLRGRWLAATVERHQLAAWDTAGSSALLVLISDRPFAEALAEQRP